MASIQGIDCIDYIHCHCQVLTSDNEKAAENLATLTEVFTNAKGSNLEIRLINAPLFC